MSGAGSIVAWVAYCCGWHASACSVGWVDSVFAWMACVASWLATIIVIVITEVLS